MKRLTIVVKNGRVEELIADTDMMIDVYDLDCINAGYDPEFNVYMSADKPGTYKSRMKDLEETIDNMIKEVEPC
jgi:hypothetical protein